MSDADHSPRRAPRPSEPHRAPAPQGAGRPARLLLPVALCAALLVAPLLLHRPVSGPTRVAASHTTGRAVTSGGAPGSSRMADGRSSRSGRAAASRSADVAYTAAQLADLQAAASGMVSIQAASPAVPATGTPGAAAATTGPTTSSTTSSATGGTDAQAPPPAPRAQTSAPPSSTTTTEAPTTTTTEAPTTTTTTEPPTTTTTAAPSHSQTGSASWYQAPTGTCAHPTLPFGTVVTVTNLANGETTRCTVEDRGPYQGGRIIDLAEGTFAQIASTSDGVIQVRIQW